jgi:hypothetical protein
MAYLNSGRVWRCWQLRASDRVRAPEGSVTVTSNIHSQVTEHYAWDTFTSIGQGHAVAAKNAGQFRQGEALRWGLLPHGGTQIIGTCGYTRWSQDNHFAVSVECSFA